MIVAGLAIVGGGPGGLPWAACSRVFSMAEACDFVFHQQLATFQLNDLEIVDRRMSARFGYFRFQAAMPSDRLMAMRVLEVFVPDRHVKSRRR